MECPKAECNEVWGPISVHEKGIQPREYSTICMWIWNSWIPCFVSSCGPPAQKEKKMHFKFSTVAVLNLGPLHQYSYFYVILSVVYSTKTKEKKCRIYNMFMRFSPHPPLLLHYWVVLYNILHHMTFSQFTDHAFYLINLSNFWTSKARFGSYMNARSDQLLSCLDEQK